MTIITPNNEPKLVVKSKQGANIIPLNTIAYLAAESNYTKIVGINKGILAPYTLKKFDQCLSSFGFFRCHKSYLVNIAFVQELCCNDQRNLILTIPKEIPVSREGMKRLRLVLGL
jgi:DNA-binding LytR/AlgR family response regulator